VELLASRRISASDEICDVEVGKWMTIGEYLQQTNGVPFPLNKFQRYLPPAEERSIESETAESVRVAPSTQIPTSHSKRPPAENQTSVAAHPSPKPSAPAVKQPKTVGNPEKGASRKATSSAAKQDALSSTTKNKSSESKSPELQRPKTEGEASDVLLAPLSHVEQYALYRTPAKAQEGPAADKSEAPSKDAKPDEGSGTYRLSLDSAAEVDAIAGSAVADGNLPWWEQDDLDAVDPLVSEPAANDLSFDEALKALARNELEAPRQHQPKSPLKKPTNRKNLQASKKNRRSTKGGN
jgi:hypothetical protein